MVLMDQIVAGLGRASANAVTPAPLQAARGLTDSCGGVGADTIAIGQSTLSSQVGDAVTECATWAAVAWARSAISAGSLGSVHVGDDLGLEHLSVDSVKTVGVAGARADVVMPFRSRGVPSRGGW